VKGHPLRRTVRTSQSALALVAATALLVTGCGREEATGGGEGGGAAADPGITDTTVTVGQSVALSGATAGAGSCNLAGWQAYLGRVNAEGGVEMGDGKTRTVEIKSYDDGYDPARAVSNLRQMQAENVFANVGSLGTPTNLAAMPVANQTEFPQVFVASGSTAFNADQEANPWTIGWQPTYVDEGRSFGEFLVEAGRPLTVAVLAQNDALGEDFTNGLEEAIEGSDVSVVARATYEPTDPTVDSQIANLAQSKADVLFNAVSVEKLAASALSRAQQVGWLPQVYLASVASSRDNVINPGGGDAYPAIYSAGFIKRANDPQFAGDEDAQQFTADIEEHASGTAASIINNCFWGYASAATFVEALELMEEPTRQGLMDAIRKVQADDIPLLLDGLTVDATDPTQAPLSELAIQRYADGSYSTADALQQ
jgi:ABC-type branched-subunit amino acid transport system substrate-binding protein